MWPEIINHLGIALLFAYAYCLLMLYLTQWLYVKQGFERMDQEENAEPVTLKQLFGGKK